MNSFGDNINNDHVIDQASADTSNEKGEVLFSPPLYKQRYAAVLDIIKSYSDHRKPLSSVADLGCAELKFVSLLKEVCGVEKVMGLDIDTELLSWKSRNIGPLPSDYLHSQRRGAPLDMEVFSGSVAHHDSRFKDIDAVTMIELVEHLHPAELEKVPEAVFGHMGPRLVVVTTPNSDYNELFPDWGGGMRHWDHKFEWTRDQFEEWANGIVGRFDNYRVSFSGVGWTEGREESHGPCSQIATFIKLEGCDYVNCCDSSQVYELVASYSFPFTIDNRTLEEKILEESQYYLNYRARDKMMYEQRDDDSYEDQIEQRIELESLLDYSFINNLTEDVEIVKNVLKKAGWRVEDGKVIVKVEIEESEESNDDQDDFGESDEGEFGIYDNSKVVSNIENEWWDDN